MIFLILHLQDTRSARKKIEMFDGINERSFDKTKKHKNTKHGLPPKF